MSEYTQTLWSVMGRELYPAELRKRDREHLFMEWLDANPEAVAEMEGWAVQLGMRGKPVSVQYLMEKERYEGTAELHPVPYCIEGGETRRYSINHNDRALLGRWLQRRHPEISVMTRKSRFDEPDDEREQTHQQFIDGFADYLMGIDIDRQIFGGAR